MKAHALPDHNFVAFMTLGLVKKEPYHTIEKFTKTIAKLWNKDCDPAMQSTLLAHKILFEILVNTNRRINHYILRKNVSKMNGRMVIGNCVVQRGQDAHIFCP